MRWRSRLVQTQERNRKQYYMRIPDSLWFRRRHAWLTVACVRGHGLQEAAFWPGEQLSVLGVGQIDMCLGAAVVQGASTTMRRNVFLSNIFYKFGYTWTLSCNRCGYVTGSLRVGL
jgi:hypothetical protein